MIDSTTNARRQFLRVGALTPLGLNLAGWLRARAASPPAGRRDTNCIFLWLLGGASHIDLFDPKPDAPAEVRGLFRPISTRLPGCQIGELLPRLATSAHRLSLIRSMTSPENEHEIGHYFVQSGMRWSRSLVPAGYGARVSHQRQRSGGVPPFVQLGEMLAAAHDAGMGGYLGRSHDPMAILQNPNAESFQVAGLAPASGMDAVRLSDRRALRSALESDPLSGRPGQTQHDRFVAQAFDVIRSPLVRQAFELSREPARMRDAYGRNTVGQRLLLARRLIEAGVRFVTVVCTIGPGWDMHPEVFPRLRIEAPPYDQGLAALLEDLAQRGRLDSTLVVSSGEFGRTPKLNDDPRGPGRDHWSRCFSVTLGGGGVKTGVVLGASDRIGAFVKDRPVTVPDLAATIYHVLGLDPRQELRASDGRPIVALPEGEPIRELL